jgi:hypothetical protein
MCMRNCSASLWPIWARPPRGVNTGADFAAREEGWGFDVRRHCGTSPCLDALRDFLPESLDVNCPRTFQLHWRCPKFGVPFALPLFIELHGGVLHAHLHLSVVAVALSIALISATAGAFSPGCFFLPDARFACAGAPLATLSGGLLARVPPFATGLLATNSSTALPGQLFRPTDGLYRLTGVLYATCGHLWGLTNSLFRSAGPIPPFGVSCGLIGSLLGTKE